MGFMKDKQVRGKRIEFDTPVRMSLEDILARPRPGDTVVLKNDDRHSKKIPIHCLVEKESRIPGMEGNHWYYTIKRADNDKRESRKTLITIGHCTIPNCQNQGCKDTKEGVKHRTRAGQ